MIVKIWRVLTQILFYRNDSIEVIKPFFENLKNETINDEKYIPLLKTFSKDQLEFLYQNRIISEAKFNFFIPGFNFSFSPKETKFNKIEEII